MAKANTAVAEAYERSKEARNAMYELNARQMECTEDKCGIVWERFVMPWGESVIVVATPHWWDIFAPVTNDGRTEITLSALAARGAAKADQSDKQAK